MNRREALVLIAAGCGGAIFGAHRLLAGDVNPVAVSSKPKFSNSDRVLLNEVGEVILPATPGSGGAKAANVADFMEDMVREFYAEKEQAAFLDGLVQLQAGCRAQFSGREFRELTPAEQHDFVFGLDQAKPQLTYYRMIKQLVMWGYFTSEIGATQARRHVAIPGRFDGIVTIPPGTKAWSE